MFNSIPMRIVGLALVLAVAAGCSSKKPAIYEHENFDDSGTFSRNYPATDVQTCEGARRALLSQGYIITSNDPKLISGHKSFQQTGETHMEISFNVVCADDGSEQHHSTMFANALQDRYALKQTNNSASIGVGVLGSLSMPIGSSDDSMIKVASETVSSAKFYERFFALAELFLPQEAKKSADITEQPKTDLGIPETREAPTQSAPAAAPVLAPAAESSPVPVVDAPADSAPVAPPAESAPITPSGTTEPVLPSETLAAPPPSSLPPTGEPTPALPSADQ